MLELRRLQAEAAARELEARRTRPRKWGSPGAMAAQLDPLNSRSTAALDLIDRELVAWADAGPDGNRFLMVMCPPQEGKSQKVSRRTPAWLLAHDPTLRIAIVSYATNKAERWGRAIRRDILAHPELNILLRQDSRAAGRWETEQGGQLIAVGIDGGITGEPVDVLIIDDPVRGRAEAESATYRENAWDWWESNGSTRLSSRGRAVLMMTRWHEDDLAGRLLSREPGKWRVVKIPAIAEDGDPLGRAPGEELVSVQNRQPGYFRGLKATRSPYVWQSIYMQAPSAAEGLIFKRVGFRYWTPAPADSVGERIDCAGRVWPLQSCWRFGAVDLAASTKSSADWTVVVALAVTPDGDIIVLDMARARVSESQHFMLVRPLAERWQFDTTFVERSAFGTTLATMAAQAGIGLTPVTADTDKLTRALPASAKVANGKVWLPANAPWLETWLNEFASFPVAVHDDIVDAFAHGVRAAVTKWDPSPRTPPRPAPDEVDFMSAPM